MLGGLKNYEKPKKKTAKERVDFPILISIKISKYIGGSSKISPKYFVLLFSIASTYPVNFKFIGQELQPVAATI